jgi:hypothetical protein
MGRRMARLYVSEAGFRHPNVKERLGRAVPATAERSAGNKRSQLSLGLRTPECERFFLLPLDPATNELWNPANLVQTRLSKHQALVATPRADHVQSGTGTTRIGSSAQGLAVDRDDLAAGIAEPGREFLEASKDWSGITQLNRRLKESWLAFRSSSGETCRGSFG